MSEKRKKYMRDFGLTEDQCYADWKDILSKPKMADIAIIATVDNMHYEPAMKAIELGYNLLLEKPVANTEKECVEIANAAKKKGVKVLVCHVLRYTPFYKKVKSIVKSGILGEVMSVEQSEAIGDVHFSHSYVRGNWHNTSTSAPMLLAKSCHDLDVIQWLVDKPCTKVSSFGDLTYFTEKNAPEGTPVSCVDGECPYRENCIYNCHKIYMGEDFPVWRDLFRSIHATKPDFTDEDVIENLRKTSYGRCVFHSDNDVLDHQVVNMQFEGGATATLTVNAFNRGGRYTRVYGTKGELYAYFADKEINVRTFADRRKFTVPVEETTSESIAGGHGGGDAGISFDLYNFLEGNEIKLGASEIGISVYNHLIGFAAEEARHTDTVVAMDAFCKKHNLK
jgi:predicted dehydrogenase